MPFGTVVQTDIKYTYEILNMDILALKKIYPFLKYGNVGKSVLNRNIPYIKIGKGKRKVLYNHRDCLCIAQAAHRQHI